VSLKAKGLLLTVMSLPDDWDFTIRGLGSILRESRDAIYTAITELKQFGYCLHEQKRENGAFGPSTYIFLEDPENTGLEPHTENQDTDNPDSGNLNTENPPQLNTKGIKETKNKRKSKKAPLLTVEEVVTELAKVPAYAHIDVRAQAKLAQDWITKHPPRQFTEAYFTNWLNRIPIPLVMNVKGRHGPGCDTCKNDPNRDQITLKSSGWIFDPVKKKVFPCECRDGAA
jgi:hypothetical protein